MSVGILKNALPIGIDMGTSSIKMAHMNVPNAKTVELLAMSAVEIPQECRGDFSRRLFFIGQAIRDQLKSGRFKTNQCVMSLPACHTTLQHVKLPRLPASEIPKVLRHELAGKLPYPVEQAVIRHTMVGEVLGDGDGRQEIIVVAASRTTVEAYLQMAKQTKLEVVGINVESAAVAECFARIFRRAADTTRTIMFVDLGATSTQVVLTHGERMVFARNIAHGERQLDQAVAAGMNISPEEAHALRWKLQKGNQVGETEDLLYTHMESSLGILSSEIMQCLHYHESIFRNQPVERAIFVGGQAYDKRLCQNLAQRLNLPAQIGDPLLRVNNVEQAGIASTNGQHEPQPHWAVAVGLSLGFNQKAA